MLYEDIKMYLSYSEDPKELTLFLLSNKIINNDIVIIIARDSISKDIILVIDDKCMRIDKNQYKEIMDIAYNKRDQLCK